MTLGGDSSRAAIARSSAIRETKRRASRNLNWLRMWFNSDSSKQPYQLQYEESMESHLCTVTQSNADSILKNLVQDHTAASKLKKLILAFWWEHAASRLGYGYVYQRG